MTRHEARVLMIRVLMNDLMDSIDEYEKEEKRSPEICNGNFMNPNHGKCALKRKITTLRNELLNYEKVL